MKHTAAVRREAIELYRGGLGCRQVGERLRELGRSAPSATTVHSWVRDAGIARRPKVALRLAHGISPAVERQILELASARLLTSAAIGRIVGVSHSTARRALLRHGIVLDYRASALRARWFSDTPGAKERRSRRELVIELRRAGRPYREIVAETGVSGPTVWSYLRQAGLVRVRRRRRRPRSRGAAC